MQKIQNRTLAHGNRMWSCWEKRQLNHCPSRELSCMIRESKYNKAFLQLVLCQFYQLCCSGGTWEARREWVSLAHRKRMKFCTAHLWPGSAHLSKSPNLGTWNSLVASVVNRNRLALSASDRTQINFLEKLWLLWLQPLCWAAKALFFPTLLRHVPTHRQDKTVLSTNEKNML